jgi:Na+-transporting methylmalonyl-CoA/oxaloacetate decarboxylase gamma subunit
MSELLSQSLLVTIFGMTITFAALGLVMLSMYLLTRLTTAEADSSRQSETARAETEKTVQPDIELPAGTPLEQVAAAAVAVAVARELARQRQSALVWSSSQPRSLISPWQLMSREQQKHKARQ